MTRTWAEATKLDDTPRFRSYFSRHRLLRRASSGRLNSAGGNIRGFQRGEGLVWLAPFQIYDLRLTIDPDCLLLSAVVKTEREEDGVESDSEAENVWVDGAGFGCD
jgi:hypothetical protein